jgi:hypothetical protein
LLETRQACKAGAVLVSGFLEETKDAIDRQSLAFIFHCVFFTGQQLLGFRSREGSSCPTHPTPQEFAATKSEWIPSRTAKREVQK